MELDLDKVPLRESGMEAWEIMISESQERMLLVAQRGREEEVFKVFRKWDLEAVEVGQVTDTGRLRVSQDGILVADMPASPLALGGGAPVYERETRRPAYLDKLKEIGNLQEPENFEKTALDLLARPNITSKRWVYRQYDHMVRGNSRVLPGGGDAAVVRVPGTKKALGMSTDCNPRYVYLDPRKGASMAVAEAARNVACTGARPLGVTNCLNFGNPYKPEMYWQFVEAVAGMGEACRVLETPVTGGNVSFYNENPAGSIFATPTIGIVGLAEDVAKTVGMAFPEDHQAIYVIGSEDVSWAGSEWQVMQQGGPRGELPPLDLQLEKRVQELLIQGIAKGYVLAAHDISEGGLVTALCEMAVADRENSRGALLEMEEVTPLKLFGEGPSRAVVVVDCEKLDEFEELAESLDVPAEWLGTTGGVGIGFRQVFRVLLEDIQDAYYNSLERHLGLK